MKLEINERHIKQHTGMQIDGAVVMITPAIDEDYWSFRVRLSASQAVVAFPKFMTMAIGFAREDDWNTNLPYTCSAEKIYQHIEHNKGDEGITKEDVIKAIEMLQQAIEAQVSNSN